MGFVKANPNEYLVVGRKGMLRNHGTGIQVFLGAGATYVRIPSTKQEALFEMTQETKDGIPLRFKGIVIYRITDPVTAAVSFNFNKGTGIQEINLHIGNICLGELRALVSMMTMEECIEQRKLVLTATITQALRDITANSGDTVNNKWGIELELVQVAQVFIVDVELRKQLEANVRNEILSLSEQSDIRTKEEIEQAKMMSRCRQLKQEQEIEKESILLSAETSKLSFEVARDKAETETPIRLFQIEKQLSIYNAELEMKKVEKRVCQLEVERDLLSDLARQEMRKDILPIEQLPMIAESLSKVFKDTQLSFVGSEQQLFSLFLPLLQGVANFVKKGI